jgi:hypothetical protein
MLPIVTAWMILELRAAKRRSESGCFFERIIKVVVFSWLRKLQICSSWCFCI